MTAALFFFFVFFKDHLIPLSMTPALTSGRVIERLRESNRRQRAGHKTDEAGRQIKIGEDWSQGLALF